MLRLPTIGKKAYVLIPFRYSKHSVFLRGLVDFIIFDFLTLALLLPLPLLQLRKSYNTLYLQNQALRTSEHALPSSNPMFCWIRGNFFRFDVKDIFRFLYLLPSFDDLVHLVSLFSRIFPFICCRILVRLLQMLA